MGAKTNVGYGQFITPEKLPDPIKQYDALELHPSEEIEARYLGFNKEGKKHEFEINLLNFNHKSTLISVGTNKKLPEINSCCTLKITVLQKNKNGQISNIQFNFLQ